jgi:hypothetical protein
MSAEPVDPVIPSGLRRPVLRLTLAPDAYPYKSLRCYIGGSDDVEMRWAKGRPGQLTVRPGFDLAPGRHRTNCTMPSSQKGRYHWYSHNWFVRKPDGSWYSEY